MSDGPCCRTLAEWAGVMYPTCEAKPYRGYTRVHPPHSAVADHLGDDRSRGDRRALLVTVDDRPMLRSGGTEAEPVDEADLGRWRKRVQMRSAAPRDSCGAGRCDRLRQTR